MSKTTNYSASNLEDGRFIQAAIDNGIRLKAQELKDKYKVQLEKDLEVAVAQVVANVSLNIASELNFQDMGKTIRFEIRKNTQS